MDNVDEKMSIAFGKVVGPLVERLTQLEERVREREFEMIVYRHAYENLIKELNDWKGKLKLVPAGELSRQVPPHRDYDQRVREEAGHPRLPEAQPRLLDYLSGGTHIG